MKLIKLNKEEIAILLNKLTKERTTKFWGDKYVGSDCLIEEVHGDGMQLVWFQTMDSRPFCYYLRVDSSLDFDLDDYEVLNEKDREIFSSFSEMLMQMIEEEHDNIDRYEEQDDGLYTNDQDKDEGHPPFEFKFPMLSSDTGYSWGAFQ